MFYFFKNVFFCCCFVKYLGLKTVLIPKLEIKCKSIFCYDFYLTSLKILLNLQSRDLDFFFFIYSKTRTTFNLILLLCRHAARPKLAKTVDDSCLKNICHPDQLQYKALYYYAGCV